MEYSTYIHNIPLSSCGSVGVSGGWPADSAIYFEIFTINIHSVSLSIVHRQSNKIAKFHSTEGGKFLKQIIFHEKSTIWPQKINPAVRSDEKISSRDPTQWRQQQLDTLYSTVVSPAPQNIYELTLGETLSEARHIPPLYVHGHGHTAPHYGTTII